MRLSDWTPWIAFTFDLLLRTGLSVRIIMRRRPVGVSLAWLTLVLIFPWVGAPIYLLFGELRLGRRRARRAEAIHGPFLEWHNRLGRCEIVDWSRVGSDYESMARMTSVVAGIPAHSGNALDLLAGADQTFSALIADIDQATRSCHLEFYIWFDGGRAELVAEALLRAAGRGVKCRVLVDAVGSRDFLNGPTARRLQDGGVAVRAAFPVGLVRTLFVRFDLRLHRKIVIIDDTIAYTGSLNLVDPRLFKRDADVGEWVDAMVRVRGPVVEDLSALFLEDWELDTGEGLDSLPETAAPCESHSSGPAIVQVIPSGPQVGREGAVPAVLLLAIYRARRELILTTPYFVPDEVLLVALISAAMRGVAVTLIVPRRVDSRLVRLASNASLGDLAESGVRVLLFEGGLLHTKSVTVDGEMSLMGTLNLDPRSFYLNFEITLAVYDRAFSEDLRRLQQSYAEQSQAMDLDVWRSRSGLERLADNAARLLSPLL
jgi:cardiolipin synthase